MDKKITIGTLIFGVIISVYIALNEFLLKDLPDFSWSWIFWMLIITLIISFTRDLWWSMVTGSPQKTFGIVAGIIVIGAIAIAIHLNWSKIIALPHLAVIGCGVLLMTILGALVKAEIIKFPTDGMTALAILGGIIYIATAAGLYARLGSVVASAIVFSAERTAIALAIIGIPIAAKLLGKNKFNWKLFFGVIVLGIMTFLIVDYLGIENGGKNWHLKLGMHPAITEFVRKYLFAAIGLIILVIMLNSKNNWKGVGQFILFLAGIWFMWEFVLKPYAMIASTSESSMRRDPMSETIPQEWTLHAGRIMEVRQPVELSSFKDRKFEPFPVRVRWWKSNRDPGPNPTRTGPYTGIVEKGMNGVTIREGSERLWFEAIDNDDKPLPDKGADTSYSFGIIYSK